MGGLGAFWGGLGASQGCVLGLLEAIFGRSWGGLGRNGGPLDGQIAKILMFPLVLLGFGGPAPPARPPTGERAGAVEGVRGRHKSLPQRTWIRIWLDLCFEGDLHALRHSLRSVPRRIFFSNNKLLS